MAQESCAALRAARYPTLRSAHLLRGLAYTKYPAWTLNPSTRSKAITTIPLVGYSLPHAALRLFCPHPRIVSRIDVNDFPWAEATQLDNCFAARPRKMGHLGGHRAVGPCRKWVRSVGIKTFPAAQVHHSGDDCETFGSWVPVGEHSITTGQLEPHREEAFLRRIAF